MTHRHLLSRVPVLVLTWLASVAAGANAQGTSRPVTALQRQQLSALRTLGLLSLLTQDSIEVNLRRGVSANFAPTVAHELIQRHPYRELVGVFVTSNDLTQEAWIVRILGKLRSAVIDSAMRALATPASDARAMFALEYFAETGQPWALRQLANNYGSYRVWIEYRQDLLRLFRDHCYAPAGVLLADEVGDGNATTSGLAVEALRAIFPEQRSHSAAEEFSATYWTTYVAQHRPDTSHTGCGG